MQLAVQHGDKSVSFESVRNVMNTKTGALLPISKWAAANGLDLSGPDKKTHRANYARLQGEFGRQVKQAAVVAVLDDRFIGKKFKFATSTKTVDGVEVVTHTGYDISLRSPSKAAVKADSAKAQLTDALAKIAALEAKLAAALPAPSETAPVE